MTKSVYIRKRSTCGFTVLELLIVIAIICVVAARCCRCSENRKPKRAIRIA